MTTRITLAILLVTWTIIVVGDSAAFFTSREALLTLLDDSLVARATPLLDHSLNPQQSLDLLIPPGDTYEIRDSGNHAVRGFTAVEQPPYQPVVLNKAFQTRADGKRYRTVIVTAMGKNGRPISPSTTVVYSRPAESFDHLIDYLIAVLSSVGMFCGLATGWVALKISRIALRPLTETADVIAAIDEKNLSRRIESHRLPSELVPMTNRLNEMLERLERVFSQRRQFLADAAHELRTPTAGLLTTLEVSLRRQRDQKALVEAMESALADARLLRRLVDKLMEQVRSDHTMDRPILEELDLAALLRDCITTVQSTAAEKQVTIEANIPRQLLFTTQRDRLQSIVINLLSNAVEYNRPGGSVNLTVSLNEQLELRVRDTGSGISPEHLPHVFEPFYRADRQKQGDTEHLGLGLFLVQSHIRALGGHCTIESPKAQGTTVIVTLPRLVTTPAQTAPTGAESATS